MPTLWPLTARGAELDLLGSWYAEDDLGGCVVSGPAGVGKSRLAEEARRLASDAGLPTARAVGHPSVQPIPLGALAHLLPSDTGDVSYGEDGRSALFHAARASLQERAAGKRLLLVVDDIDQLDETSIAALVPLTVHRTVFLVATMRAGRALPAALQSLLKDEHLRRLELGALSPEQVATLIHRVLDAPLERAGLRRLQTLSAGNVQLLRELVRTSLDRGTLRRDGDSWHLDSTDTSAALEELVLSRLGDLDAPARHALELLAVAGQLGLADLEALTPTGALDGLEEQGVLTIERDGRRVNAGLSHPLYAEVLRGRISTVRERALQRALADRFDGRARRREDALRLALWRLEGGGDVDAGLLLRAGRLALAARDAAMAHRFAEAAAERGARCEAAIVSVEAHLLLGDTERADAAALAVWRDPALDDRQLAHLARRRADMRFAADVDLPGALELNADALARMREPAAAASVIAHRASLLANAARPLEAVAVASSVHEDALDDPFVRVEVATARSLALLTMGRAGDAVAAVRQAAQARSRMPPWLARRGQAGDLITEAHALAYSGSYAQAAAMVAPALDRARASGMAAAGVWFELVLAEIARDTGKGAEAVRRFSAAAASARAAGQSAAMVWALVGIAQGHLLQGNLEEAARTLHDADAFGDSPVGTSRSTRERCRAWLTAARGDLTAARAALLAIADEVAADGVFVFEVALRHDVVRFGDAKAVVERLEELAAMVDGPLVQTFAAHARGTVNADPAILSGALEALDAIGSHLLAAELAAELAELHRHRGDQRAAAATDQRVRQLIEQCGGARTPPLLRGTMVDPLTAREREVALMAAGGTPSKEIAARLFLSKRTVDTHLDRVYRKLGIRGRDELRAALGPAGDT